MNKPGKLAREALTREDIFRRLDYNPASGQFVWKAVSPPHSRCKTGAEAGCIVPEGYRKIVIGYHAYLAHRLAWFLMHGKWPANQIDHIDGVRANNAIANLRECTNAQNITNGKRRTTNSSGFLGIQGPLANGRYCAGITHLGAYHYLGTHDTAQAAFDAYSAAAIKLKGEFGESAIAREIASKKEKPCA